MIEEGSKKIQNRGLGHTAENPVAEKIGKKLNSLYSRTKKKLDELPNNLENLSKKREKLAEVGHKHLKSIKEMAAGLQETGEQDESVPAKEEGTSQEQGQNFFEDARKKAGQVFETLKDKGKKLKEEATNTGSSLAGRAEDFVTPEKVEQVKRSVDSFTTKFFSTVKENVSSVSERYDRYKETTQALNRGEELAARLHALGQSLVGNQVTLSQARTALEQALNLLESLGSCLQSIRSGIQEADPLQNLSARFETLEQRFEKLGGIFAAYESEHTQALQTQEALLELEQSKSALEHSIQEAQGPDREGDLQNVYQGYNRALQSAQSEAIELRKQIEDSVVPEGKRKEEATKLVEAIELLSRWNPDPQTPSKPQSKASSQSKTS